MVNRKCICNLCSCGRHHRLHLPTKIYEKTEKPCLLSEYTENYKIHESYLPRDSFKPQGGIQERIRSNGRPDHIQVRANSDEQTAHMKAVMYSVMSRRDFGLHKMLPKKFHQPDPYTPSQENMDLLTTYKHDFNYLPVCQVGLVKPRDSKFLHGDKIQYLPTYKGEQRTEESTGRALDLQEVATCTST